MIGWFVCLAPPRAGVQNSVLRHSVIVLVINGDIGIEFGVIRGVGATHSRFFCGTVIP